MPRSPNRTADQLSLLQLMWAPSTKVGRSGVTVVSLIEAAVALADDSGLGALTMRAVAERVGIGVMTLYGYVPGKPELLELMLDSVAGATYAVGDRPGDQQGWQVAVRHIAARNYAHALAHGWSVEVPPGRPILGPGICQKYEWELTPLDGIGLSDKEMDDVVTTLVNMATGAARWQLGLDRVRADSQLSDENWWALSQPVLASAMEGRELPVSARVDASLASAGDPRQSLLTGVELLITGLDQTLTTR
jgi:AcrR family transcriptional regulator